MRPTFPYRNATLIEVGDQNNENSSLLEKNGEDRCRGMKRSLIYSWMFVGATGGGLERPERISATTAPAEKGKGHLMNFIRGQSESLSSKRYPRRYGDAKNRIL